MSDQRLARLYHQACAQQQGQICMINFEAFQDHQDFMIQLFRSASGRIRRAFTPPPRQGSDGSSHSDHSDEDNVPTQIQVQEDQRDQNVRNAFIQNVSATRRWWSFIAFIMSIMHLIAQGYQFTNVMINKVKQLIAVSVNVNQVWKTLLYVFSMCSVSCHLIIHHLNHLAWQPSRTQQSHPALKRCISCQPQLPAWFSEWQQLNQLQQRSMKRQHQLPSQFKASLWLMSRMRSSTMMLKLKLSITHSVRLSQLRKIKSCSVSWSMSQSAPNLQGKSICSSASSSLKWQIILNSGTITQETSGTSLAASSTIRETSRRCSASVKDVIDLSLCSVSQSI